jgi:NAD(P)-dependent dehydrogenase (short-subunit alcohol dehydrogenase family)
LRGLNCKQLITPLRKVWRTSLLTMFAALLMAQTAHAETVMITGANSGLGLELARQYATMGWTVIAVHRHDSTPQTLAELIEQHGNVRAERMDITDEAAVRALSRKLADVPIDVLINNAADTKIGPTQRFGQLDFEQGKTVLTTNILGPLLVSEAFLPQIEAGKRKQIITITSTHASLTRPLPGPGAIFYRASKAGLNRAMIVVADTLRPQGIAVVLVHPGSMRMSAAEPATNAYGERVMVDIVARKLIATIGRLSMADSGHFLQYDGTSLAW